MFHVKQNKNKIRRTKGVFTPQNSFSPAALSAIRTASVWAA
jgi:hypothetical protein